VFGEGRDRPAPPPGEEPEAAAADLDRGYLTRLVASPMRQLGDDAGVHSPLVLRAV